MYICKSVNPVNQTLHSYLVGSSRLFLPILYLSGSPDLQKLIINKIKQNKIAFKVKVKKIYVKLFKVKCRSKQVSIFHVYYDFICKTITH